MIIDDAWAENEVEKQLSALSPILSIDKAEEKLQLFYSNEGLLLSSKLSKLWFCFL